MRRTTSYAASVTMVVTSSCIAKGAVPASHGQIGVIPGSAGTFSVHVKVEASPGCSRQARTAQAACTRGVMQRIT